MRFLRFTGGEDNSMRRYALIQLAFQRSQYRPRAVTDGAVIADVVRAVNKIGTEYGADEPTKGGDDDLDDDELASESKAEAVKLAEPMLRLSDNGGTVRLETNETKMLLELIGATAWQPMFMPNIEELKSWIRKSPKDRKRADEHEEDVAEEGRGTAGGSGAAE